MKEHGGRVEGPGRPDEGTLFAVVRSYDGKGEVMAHVVLIVEDDDDVRENLALLLELRGYEVETARHGKQALEKITSARPPCLIILDLMMPIMNGWQLWAELQKDPGLASVPVVLLSAMADVNEEAKSLDAVDYLSKPIDLTKLYRVVSAHC